MASWASHMAKAISPEASAGSCGLSWRSSPMACILLIHQQYPHLQALEEIERDGIPGLVEVLCEEGVETVRYVLWDATGQPPRLQPARLAQAGY